MISRHSSVIQLREVDFSSHRGVVDQDVEAPERYQWPPR